MRESISLRRLSEGAVIAALYTVLTVGLSPISYGLFQCRVSEALTILPAFTPSAIPGLAVGCLISNTIGLAMGLNVAGPLDIVLGTAATLLAAFCSYALRNIRFKDVPVLSALPPVLFNAVIIGAELSVAFNHPLWISMLVEVGAGELAACLVLGVPLATVLVKTGAGQRIFGQSITKRI